MTAPHVVDIHTHVIPPALVDRVRAGAGPDGMRLEPVDGVEWMVHRQGYRYPLEAAFHDLPTRLRAMDEAGTDAAVVSPAPPLFLYWTDAATAIDAARLINDGIAAMVAQAPDRLAGLATLPMQDPEAAVAELRRAVEELGLRGAEIGPHIEGVPLDDPAFRPVLAEAERLGVPLELHPYYVGAADGPLADFYLTNLQGNPWQTTLAASRLILSGALDDVPHLDVVLLHAGGHLPYQIGRLDHGHRVRAEAAAPAHAPSTYLHRFAYDCLSHDPEVTRWLIERVGADRVLYGTDVPFDMAGGSFADQLSAVHDPDVRSAVGAGNALRLFGGFGPDAHRARTTATGPTRGTA